MPKGLICTTIERRHLAESFIRLAAEGLAWTLQPSFVRPAAAVQSEGRTNLRRWEEAGEGIATRISTTR